jgi:hypothetical protein
MKEGPSGSAIRSLIPSRRKLLWSKVMVVSVAEDDVENLSQIWAVAPALVKLALRDVQPSQKDKSERAAGSGGGSVMQRGSL